MIDENMIAHIKEVNKTYGACAFNFLDKDGGYAAETKKPFVTAEIIFVNGETYTMSAQTFEAFGEYKFKLASVMEH